MLPEGTILGLGNPLLDITVQTTPDFLRKYGLSENDARLATPQHDALFDDIQEMKPRYSAGGATLNSIRVAQWILNQRGVTGFVGAIGKDASGGIMKSCCKEVGVECHFLETEEERTGVCAALITGENRSLVTHLGASLKFDHSFLNEDFSFIERANLYYIGGFAFDTCKESVKRIAKHSIEKNKTLVMNLSAPFLCHYFAEEDILSSIDVLVGNEDEAKSLMRSLNFDESKTVEEMAEIVQRLPKSGSKERVVIFTRGANSTVIANSEKIFYQPPKPIKKEEIRDTNGCGDAFVGGFLSQLVQGKCLEECVDCGAYAASIVIKYFGCDYPPTCSYEYKP
ncbi:DgyrCDS12626 [Dimorphilus gyrociliatus]|uniref:Adenosine kinase n=1 Tax=Dimorphilus gyrociliatus TaxID=2664684 RepID=A0A7I8W725_9ANNE|nr:DgyrCDS12626 [Dimorphilus gyrociliatus]